MPTYEYQCAKGHVFEVFQKISDKPVAKCPTCKSAAKRLISGGAGLIFKGSGFYITDYGKDGKGPRKAESAESSGTSTESAEKPSGEKPADKPAEKKKTKPSGKSKA
ncbi:MAG: FmdB family zinc ribbon protein [Gemmatimonadales bacterium]